MDKNLKFFLEKYVQTKNHDGLFECLLSALLFNCESEINLVITRL